MLFALGSPRAARLLDLLPVLTVAAGLVSACAQGTTFTDGSGGTTTSSPSSSSSSSKTATHATASGVGGGGPGTTTTASSSASTTNASTASTTGSGMSPPGTLFFSEYVEGSANNKALEIVNAGSTSVSLNGCQIDRYMNGATTAMAPPVALDNVMLAAGQTFVVCNTSFSMTTLCDQLSANILHTGNDVASLSCNGTVKDVFGKIGDTVDWGTAPTTSVDATLRRKCSVLVGDVNGNDAFDPATEWTGFAVDTFTDLGQYICP